MYVSDGGLTVLDAQLGDELEGSLVVQQSQGPRPDPGHNQIGGPSSQCVLLWLQGLPLGLCSAVEAGVGSWAGLCKMHS